MREGPPKSVSSAVLAGGPLDGVEIEIAPGQSSYQLDGGPLLTAPPAGDAQVAATVYVFDGRLDKTGRAVFEVADEAG